MFMTTTYELRIYSIEQNPSDFVVQSKASEVQHVYNHKDGTVRFQLNALRKKGQTYKIDKIEETALNAYVDFPEGINRISADDLIELWFFSKVNKIY